MSSPHTHHTFQDTSAVATGQAVLASNDPTRTESTVQGTSGDSNMIRTPGAVVCSIECASSSRPHDRAGELPQHDVRSPPVEPAAQSGSRTGAVAVIHTAVQSRVCVPEAGVACRQCSVGAL